jgi:ATP-dependent RNA helicase RhlE
LKFQDLNLIAPILEAILTEGYTTPSPIQIQAIPVLLNKKDILASAQTGTGKTLAFAAPIIQGLYQEERNLRLKRQIKALILAPTRELAEQIKESFRNYSKDLGLRTEVIFGGVSQKSQEVALMKGIDILVATPGRLMDLFAQGLINLEHVKYLVLDEADRMLDMGFIHDVKKIVAFIPKQRQTMLFSATIPQEIMSLAQSLLKDPVRIEVAKEFEMIDQIEQSLYYVSRKDKVMLLLDILKNQKLASILIFTRTKHGANKLVKELLSYGVNADAIHGNKSQNARQKALSSFKDSKLRVLVATDIAARGIDIDELSCVINYDLPETPETYIHRMGRTGRAGLSGVAYSFCAQEDLLLLKSIEKHIKKSIPVVANHPYKQTGIEKLVEITKAEMLHPIRDFKKNNQRKKFNHYDKANTQKKKAFSYKHEDYQRETSKRRKI